MSSQNIWTCKGVKKDGTPSVSGSHEPFDNFGPNCAVCGLAREEVVGSKTGGGVPPIAIFAGGAVALALLGGVIYFLLPQPPTPTPVAVTPTPTPVAVPTTTSPPTTPTTGSSVNPAAVVTTYRILSDVPNVPSTVANYGGSTTFAPLRSPQIVSLISQAHPGFQLRYVEPTSGKKPGSGTGIRMLLDGQLSFAQSSRSVETAEFDEAKTKGFSLEQIPVAIDGIAFYVNPKLNITGLNLSQIKDIFTGKITNWKQVGGPDLPITLVSRPLSDGGTPEYFHKEVLGGENFASNLQEVRDTTTGIQTVAKTPGSIGFATASEVINQQTIRPLPIGKDGSQAFVSPCGDSSCKTVNNTAFSDNSYPITRRLFIIVKRDGKIDEQSGVAYVNLILSDEGQKLVEQAGFVPIRR
ncbi:PstS family phosphate ABC transporter substrate-binding protein [Floridanema evergladense]|uniref:PstS family phosphate ABC transporter substrate-binding protein n=1 Tax=Floridaenema evergladense BLCC-F167 TaxID=3153639 RepID=A0ABV4WSQ1_9CYAN